MEELKVLITVRENGDFKVESDGRAGNFATIGILETAKYVLIKEGEKEDGETESGLQDMSAPDENEPEKG